MSENKINTKAILLLRDRTDKKSHEVYTNVREEFVNFLKANQLDWKINKIQRRTDLFHQSLSLFFQSDNFREQKEGQSLINEIGAKIFRDRQAIKLDTLTPIQEQAEKIVQQQNSYVTEAYELEQALKKVEASERKILKKAFVENTPVTQLNRGIEEIKEVLQSLLEVFTENEVANSIEVEIRDGIYQFSTTKNPLVPIVEFLQKGFSGLSKQSFEEQLKIYEEVRVDELTLKKLKSSKRQSEGKELYWKYRKRNAVCLTKNIEYKMNQVLDVSSKVWSIFLQNLDSGKFASPLNMPLKNYLNAITIHCLGGRPDTNIGSQLDFSPVEVSQKLADWEQTIKVEEAILDRIKENDQLFFKELFYKYENDFIVALRKVFKLYDTSTRDRPSEIYNRSFSEVICKVENNELRKPLTSSFKTYLIGVGVNHYRQEYHSKKSEKPLDIDEGILENIIEIDTIENRFKNEENAHKVKQYLQAIGEPCKSLLEMKYLKGYNYEVIAIRMQKKEGALRTRVSRCLDRLRTMLFE